MVGWLRGDLGSARFDQPNSAPPSDTHHKMASKGIPTMAKKPSSPASRKNRIDSAAEVVRPNPADLIESLRDFGYTLPTAIADLLDNSITADASNITITLDSTSNQPHIALVDDGTGMSEDRLVEAMRLSSVGPSAQRDAKDLGRFGLGLKTASLSQGQCFTVLTKHRGKLAVRQWNLSHVRKAGEWQLLKSATSTATRYGSTLEAQRSGTAVVIEDLDRLSFLAGSASDRATHLSDALQTMRLHLGMVFHRFISEDRLSISIGKGKVPAWDPYLSGKSTELPTEKSPTRVGHAAVSVTPFVLPHHSKLTDEEHQLAAGLHGWNAHQGFYVYRGRRLIVPGTWLNLSLRKEEHLKLARIRVDIPNTLDGDWHLNVMKSHVAAPPSLRGFLKRIAAVTRQRAAEVYRFRGEKQAPSREQQQHFVWRKESDGRRGVRFKIDRTHPVIRALLHSGGNHDRLFAAVVGLLEATLPVAAIIQEPEKTLDGIPADDLEGSIAALTEICLHTELHFIRMGQSPAAARESVLSSEPFSRHRTVLEKHLGH